MSYVSAFVAAVPESNKDAYVEAAREAWKLFSEYGALGVHECWEDDVPDGKVTSFPMAVKREPGEKIVVSWIIWPDKATYERCIASTETDERWAQMAMPFDGKRMIYGTFTPIFTA
ncbi:RNA signal recognition particle 4.5S RNA [Oceanicola sp. 22II-s10i]|uniref:DUF1428 domain-containing protein n=1 Tax=Oceanicola sp. 22II-s10i TaxID=1317116 RepID=UPI000B520B8B|nr:DUF1428 domain-containing protein [Oceanicola sp. 22II-s10i]OWU86457.1 RNA signal recognition particle 4.5S RNA [Oceanicola sp. 22II-s10i]